MATPSQGLMRCSTCGLTKPANEMLRSSLKQGHQKQCKSCNGKYMARYRTVNREAYNAYQRRWRKPRQADLNKKLRETRTRLIAAMTPMELKEFRRKECSETAEQNALLKDEVFKAYGGWKCACCGETEKLFLTIDHVLNDGAVHRKDIGHGSIRTYRWLRKNNFPKGFQVLCMNCNFGKRMNNGRCPHQSRCND